MISSKSVFAAVLTAVLLVPFTLDAQSVVTAKINSDGDLIIQGDDDANEIVIFEITGGVRVRGLNGTSINTAGNFESDLAPVTDDVRINLYGGDDLVEVAGLVVPDVLRINTHDGDDRVILNSAFVQGDTRVFTDEVGDEGDDTVEAVEFSCGGDFEVETGLGKDKFDANTVAVSGDLMVLTGKGVDDVCLFNVFITGMTSVSMGRGSDLFFAESCFFEEDFDLLMGAGHDFATLFFNDFLGDCFTDGGGRVGQTDFIDACENTFGGTFLYEKFELESIDACT